MYTHKHRCLYVALYLLELITKKIRIQTNRVIMKKNIVTWFLGILLFI